MLRTILNKKGFTLIELTTAIVIVSILSVMAGMGLLQIANGYAFARKNAVAAEQAQIALTRLSKELSAIHTIDPDPTQTTDKSLRYKRIGDTNWRKVSWTTADQPLTLNIDEINDDMLIDKVHSFSLTYHNTYGTMAPSYSSSATVIELKFEIKVYNDILLTFVQRVTI